jgi:hypothetical protein
MYPFSSFVSFLCKVKEPAFVFTTIAFFEIEGTQSNLVLVLLTSIVYFNFQAAKLLLSK